MIPILEGELSLDSVDLELSADTNPSAFTWDGTPGAFKTMEGHETTTKDTFDLARSVTAARKVLLKWLSLFCLTIPTSFVSSN